MHLYASHGALEAANMFVMLHGAAGSHSDFRHLAPLVARHDDIRVVAFDLPGNGLTSADAAGGVHLSQDSVVAATQEAITQFINWQP
ncbi:Aste57867_21771 [Aphanomyces stellatus]|uniref:Aste57867_21771 protein n=1 Tax=Aphanomyces stellatus TaxID=120398 RepID=A0A485LIE8_9STRA|nr:hypothetical protein As57867_021702 [Aphanomyces stellatus]VFT98440.1 Aste57867_21771 [Aphanomyces stellatus]